MELIIFFALLCFMSSNIPIKKPPLVPMCIDTIIRQEFLTFGEKSWCQSLETVSSFCLNFFTVRVTEHWFRYPERLWGLCLCRYSKAVWTWSWAACSRLPCLSTGGVDKVTSRGLFQPHSFWDSVTWWFYGYQKLPYISFFSYRTVYAVTWIPQASRCFS